jgi:hypothetical protein
MSETMTAAEARTQLEAMLLLLTETPASSTPSQALRLLRILCEITFIAVAWADADEPALMRRRAAGLQILGALERGLMSG